MSKHIGEAQLDTCMVSAANTADKTVLASKKCFFSTVLFCSYSGPFLSTAMKKFDLRLQIYFCHVGGIM